MTDGELMQAALAQAFLARGRTSPNPAVGAVLARDGVIVGQGYTQPPGGPHAEVMALRQARDQAHGATLYVTLEPCNVTGRTGPCTGALIAAGVRAVRCAIIDSDERVRGGGLAQLRAAGVAIDVGLLADAAARHHADFIIHRRLGRPLVVVKFAASLDGRIAAVSGDARWVSGPPARAWVHEQRAVLDAIMVGSGTVLADDPLLTARPAGGTSARQPLRVVLDGRGRTPPAAQVLGPEAPTLVVTTAAAPDPWRAAIRGRGAELLEMPAGAGGGVAPAPLLAELGRRGVMSVLVEGGAALLGSLFDAELVDMVHAVVAPLIIGGAAPAAVAGQGAWTMAAARRLRDVSHTALGEDLLVSGYCRDLLALTAAG